MANAETARFEVQGGVHRPQSNNLAPALPRHAGKSVRVGGGRVLWRFLRAAALIAWGLAGLLVSAAKSGAGG